MATLGLKGMGKFLWEGRENGEKRNGHWIFMSTYFSLRPRWPNWLGLHSANSMVVGSNPTASNSKFCYFFILALPFSLLFPPFFPTFPKKFSHAPSETILAHCADALHSSSLSSLCAAFSKWALLRLSFILHFPPTFTIYRYASVSLEKKEKVILLSKHFVRDKIVGMYYVCMSSSHFHKIISF